MNIRNEKLEQYEIVDKSLKDAYRDKESEMMKMKRAVEEARNELREKENAVEQVKELFEKQMAEEIMKGFLQLSWFFSFRILILITFYCGITFNFRYKFLVEFEFNHDCILIIFLLTVNEEWESITEQLKNWP